LIQQRSSHLADGTGIFARPGQLPFLATNTVPARLRGLVARPRLLANLSEPPAARLDADIPSVRRDRVCEDDNAVNRVILAITQRATQRRNVDLETDGLEKDIRPNQSYQFFSGQFTSAFKQSNRSGRMKVRVADRRLASGVPACLHLDCARLVSGQVSIRG
jgi:hypothetical protein